ncbi:hypothetical protein DUI87_27086 [Hirundo rustica rustica]|uniref:HSF-type DNA-binding domain-containing protein n=1 Tax=Hirundo rustica rustica TaxID=333673 RepID=A0A3M0J4U3_HIRRU|nr:hypothetical protein DUI87_27086 [Hirundo rustica rustica]
MTPRVRSLRWDSEARGLLVDRSLFERELLRPGVAQGPAPHAFRATQFRSFVRQLYRYGFRKGFHGEQLLPPRWEGPRSRMQELYGEQPPPLDRELLWMQPCSFQQLHRSSSPQPPTHQIHVIDVSWRGALHGRKRQRETCDNQAGPCIVTIIRESTRLEKTFESINSNL